MKGVEVRPSPPGPNLDAEEPAPDQPLGRHLDAACRHPRPAAETGLRGIALALLVGVVGRGEQDEFVVRR